MVEVVPSRSTSWSCAVAVHRAVRPDDPTTVEAYRRLEAAGRGHEVVRRASSTATMPARGSGSSAGIRRPDVARVEASMSCRHATRPRHRGRRSTPSARGRAGARCCRASAPFARTTGKPARGPTGAGFAKSGATRSARARLEPVEAPEVASPARDRDRDLGRAAGPRAWHVRGRARGVSRTSRARSDGEMARSRTGCRRTCRARRPARGDIRGARRRRGRRLRKARRCSSAWTGDAFHDMTGREARLARARHRGRPEASRDRLGEGERVPRAWRRTTRSATSRSAGSTSATATTSSPGGSSCRTAIGGTD